MYRHAAAVAVHLLAKNMKTTLLLSLVPISSGLATSFRETSTSPWLFYGSRWILHNYHFNGDPETCRLIYFNLISDPTASEPAVNADCEIDKTKLSWQPCSMLIAQSADWNRGVWVMPMPTTDTVNLEIMHAFTNASAAPHLFYNLVRETSGSCELLSNDVFANPRAIYQDGRASWQLAGSNISDKPVRVPELGRI